MHDPVTQTDYGLGYEAMRLMGAKYPGLNFAAQLRQRVPLAQSERDWGIVDALIDLALEGAGGTTNRDA